MRLSGLAAGGAVWHESEMASAFKPPDSKQQLSARVRRSSHEKLERIVKIWRARATAEAGPELAREIDKTYVVDELLAKMTDYELAVWGSPDTPEKLKAVLDAIANTTGATMHLPVEAFGANAGERDAEKENRLEEAPAAIEKT